MSRVSQLSMAWNPEENTMSPVIPTSYGLSHPMCSLPRGCLEFGCEGYHSIVGACTTGAAEERRSFTAIQKVDQVLDVRLSRTHARQSRHRLRRRCLRPRFL